MNTIESDKLIQNSEKIVLLKNLEFMLDVHVNDVRGG